MKFQNIDLPFLSFEGKDKPKNNFIKIFIITALIVLGVVIFYVLAVNSSKDRTGNYSAVTPTLGVSPSPTIAETMSDIEKIRQKWNQTKNLLQENNYDSKLLQPPDLELELELDE